MSSERKTLTLNQLRAIFRRNRGAAAQLAREIGVSKVSVSDCLRGIGRSQRVEAAVRERANELLAKEEGK